MTAEAKQQEERQVSLGQQLEHMRERDALLEYMEEVHRKHEENALACLIRIVHTVNDPWKTLTEVARLREHHRSNLSRWLKDDAQVTRDGVRVNREIAEQERAVVGLQNKLAQALRAAAERERLQQAVGEASRALAKKNARGNEVEEPPRAARSVADLQEFGHKRRRQDAN